MPDMSDDDFFGAPATSTASQLPVGVTASGNQGMSDDDFFTPQSKAITAPTPEDHSFTGDIKSDLTKRAADYVGGGDYSLSHDLGTVFGGVNDVAGEAAKRIFSPAIYTLRPAANATAAAIGSTDAGKWTSDKLLDASNAYSEGRDAVSDWMKDHPTIASKLGDVANVSGGSAVLEGGIGGARAIGNAADDAYNANQVLRKAPTGALSPDVMAYQAQKGRNAAYVEGMNANAENMKMSYGHIYDGAGEISQDASVNAPQAKANVDSLVSDLDGDLTHKTEQGSSQAYRDMKAVQDSFDENGNIPLDKLTLLKRRLNDLYAPDMGDTRGKIYANLNNQVNTLIKQARVENPEWGAMMDSGNRLFNNYKSTFDVDDMANQKWSLDDKKNYEDAQAARQTDPYSAPPSTATRTKIAGLTNIDSIPQYEAMLRKLPPEMHDQFTQDVIEANKESNPRVSRTLSALYKSVSGNYAGAGHDFYKAITAGTKTAIDPALAEDFPHVEDAITHHTAAAQDAYKTYLDNMESEQAARTKGAPDRPPLALPSPDTIPPAPTDIAVSGKGAASAMTPEQQMSADAARARAKNIGLTPDVRAAQEAQKATALAERNRVARENFDKWMGRGSSKLGREVIGAGNPPLQSYPTDIPPFLRDRFASGGAVNIKPSEAQKAVGNYKKDHIKWHGLDISIENPKGSERSGVNEGKPWKSTMMADYGYIKRHIGADGDHLDCYVGPDKNSKRVYVIDQKHSDGSFDEHKCMISFADRNAAEKAYRASFSDKKNRIMKITRLTIPEFKAWLKRGNTKEPMRKAA